MPLSKFNTFKVEHMKNNIFDNLNSLSDLIFTMVDGLKREWVKVDMDTFGNVRSTPKYWFEILGTKEICFGCAATNTLCELMQKPFTKDNIKDSAARTVVVNYGITKRELETFENAVDNLRKGFFRSFLMNLSSIQHLFSFVVPSQREIYEACPNAFSLPYLHTENYKKDMHVYRAFSIELKKAGL